uniref:Inner centromere protein ARK-binding domain-containing protein n=1 Tax=Compsopogon caeruleus TaxID=31354 RepID=A0A7S1XBW9_9RHOD|mmetsp:Transcript_14376/g.29434  ORF Transcript_14376/g.29434 Transcript_14376/m.29434 type:complete len:465 (+) Transcript_14376:102-1496(+)
MAEAASRMGTVEVALRALREIGEAKCTELCQVAAREMEWLAQVRERSLARICRTQEVKRASSSTGSGFGLACPPTARKRPRTVDDGEHVPHDNGESSDGEEQAPPPKRKSGDEKQGTNSTPKPLPLSTLVQSPESATLKSGSLLNASTNEVGEDSGPNQEPVAPIAMMPNIVTSISDTVAALFPPLRPQASLAHEPLIEALQAKEDALLEECKQRKDKVEAERRAAAIAKQLEAETKRRRAEENRKRKALEEQRRELDRRKKEELREKRRLEHELIRKRQKDLEEKKKEERIRRLEEHRKRVLEEEDKRRKELELRIQGQRQGEGHDHDVRPGHGRPTGPFFMTPPPHPSLAKSAEDISCYEMTCEKILLAEESSDEEIRRRRKKKIPEWATGANLMEALHHQPEDPDVIFEPAKKTSIDLVDVFKEQPVEKRRYRKRTSSANWIRDRVTVAEEIEYRRKMGLL